MSRATKSKDYIIHSVEDIRKLPNLQTGIEVLRKYGIEARGLKHKDDAIDRLLQNLDLILNISRNEKPRPQSQRAFDDVLGEDDVNRQELSKHLIECAKYFNELPGQFKNDLNNIFPNFAEQLKDRLNDLKRNHCSILVAGETGAGKSSLINLLLGGDFMPTGTMRCTATFCEVRKSDKRLARVFPRGQPNKPKEIPLTGEQGLVDVYRYLTEVNDDEESPYDKVELYWPFPQLQDGLVLVDSPGIGENSRTSNRIFEYLQNAFGFIYVVNVGMAGGIQKDRLEELLRVVVNSGEEEFDASSAMFVCNKWDMVSDQEAQLVRNFTISKLSKLYPGLKTDQVFYISTEQATKSVQYNVPDKALDELMVGFRHLFPRTLKARLASHYRWTSSVLKRSRYTLRVTKLMDTKSIEEKEKLFDSLRNKIERLELDAEDQLMQMRKEVEDRIATVKTGLVHLFRSAEFRHQFASWELPECPKEGNWKKVMRDAQEVIALRLAHEINVWNVRTGIASSIDERIVKKFKNDFELLEDQMNQIEGVLIAGETRIVTDLHKSIKKQMPVKNMWKTAGKRKSGEDADSDISSLGYAVSSVGVVDSDNKDVKGVLKKYKNNSASETMTRLSAQFLDSILSGDRLRKALQHFFSRILKGIDEIARMIPGFLKADKHLMRNLNKEVQEKERNLFDVYSKYNAVCDKIQGRLDMFYVKKLLTFDYNFKELVWDTLAAPLGSGSFADVFLCQLKTISGPKHVAVKRCRDPLDENNVTDTLLEDRILRDLDHPNVVKYYGSSYELDRGKIKWIMILECCDTTLKHLFADIPSPSRVEIYSPHADNIRAISRYSVQICDGIQYLHNKGLVHRDLKPDNILVKDDILKLTDVGMACPKAQIAGTIAGSPAYMAPEVLLQKGLYDHRVDIYSLGIIMWEMWYGTEVAEHLASQMFGTFEETIKRGVRPSLTLSHKPPEHWVKLLRGCWEQEATNRPAVKDIRRFFELILKQ